ncbi:uncharacterized protein Z519_12552 [Cladophialophora bantiana CBS 173.52]|uniref:DUF1772 domain-containing protein n=1 Tax=Cladophialophora bantiana (strain ATCC 10958 / CBS 173.52 / CDC B-1940 / NIH 8579) TaxID=1442370 RepID=A0A0D2E9F6_CLAB1|nr:uncharacterized protein Z519_12552 [Cladophialophora bantiana CBS 173.52]KIW86766.1 hypothetical protein Z519_12552 [Cladophialophora bantiana CBS 173.52]
MDSSIYLRVAKILGVTGSAWLGGNIAGLSLLVTPALRHSSTDDGVSSSTISKQWRYIYESGKAQNPPIAAVAAVAYLYLAWTARGLAPTSQLPLYYGSAAVLTLGIVPFTLIAMSSTNNKLMRHSEALSKNPSASLQPSSDQEVDELVARWTVLNGIRSLFPLTGAILGVVAILG